MNDPEIPTEIIGVLSELARNLGNLDWILITSPAISRAKRMFRSCKVAWDAECHIGIYRCFSYLLESCLSHVEFVAAAAAL